MEGNPLESQQNIKFPEVAIVIKTMAEEDQSMRKRSDENEGMIESEEDDLLDKKNTERMREIVSEIGWPTFSRVGKGPSHDAWVLVQHADHDTDFQKLCLNLMKEAGDKEVDKKDVAYLEDRVRVNEGRPQLYGTQFFQPAVHEIYIPRTVEDVENLEKRRRDVGMETMQEYIKGWSDTNMEIQSKKLSEVLYFGMTGKEAHIHLVPAAEYIKESGIGNFKNEIVKGLNKLAEIVRLNEEVEKITATSWIVAEHPALLVKLGFTVVGEMSEEIKGKLYPDERRPIAGAFMTREDFLTRYGKE